MTARRRPWIAALLSVITPGMGHVYAGRWKRGVLVVAAIATVVMLALWSLPFLPVARATLILIVLLNVAASTGAVIDAARCARHVDPTQPPPRSSRWYVCLAFAIVVRLALRGLWLPIVRWRIHAFRLPTGSMEDTIPAGDHILVDKRAYAHRHLPQRGDIIVFLFPEDRSRMFAKRAIGLPREKVEIRHRVVYIDGRPLTEPYAKYIRPDPEPFLDDWGPEIVPEHGIFVLGDNRENSRDSRFWGYVPLDDLRGRAVVTYWSQDARTSTIRWDRIGRDLRR